MDLKTLVEKNDTKAGRYFDFFIQFLITLSLIAFSLETLPNKSDELSFWLYIIEVFTVIVFSIEYLLRLFVSDNKLKFIFSFYGLIDLFAILPFYFTSAIDLRSIRPLDYSTIINSVKKTNRLVIVDESWPFAGVSAEIAFKVQKDAFDYLDAPIIRVNSADTSLGYSSVFVEEYLPNPRKVIAACKQVLYR